MCRFVTKTTRYDLSAHEKLSMPILCQWQSGIAYYINVFFELFFRKTLAYFTFFTKKIDILTQNGSIIIFLLLILLFQCSCALHLVSVTFAFLTPKEQLIYLHEIATRHRLRGFLQFEIMGRGFLNFILIGSSVSSKLIE